MMVHPETSTPAGTSDWTLGLSWASLMGIDYHGLVDAAGAAGFDTVSVSPGIYRQAREAGFSDGDLREALKPHGLVVAAIDPLMGGVPGAPAMETAPPMMQRMLAASAADCFEAAAALGAPMIALAQPGGTRVPREEVVNAVGVIAAGAAERGLSVGIEVIANSQNIGTLDAGLDIVRRIGLDSVGVIFDSWQLFRTGVDVGSLSGFPGSMIASIQLADSSAASRGQIPAILEDRLIPGDGAIPFTEMLRTLLPLRPGVEVTLEVISKALQQLPPSGVAQRLADAARSILAGCR